MIPPCLLLTYALWGRRHILSLSCFIAMIMSTAALVISIGLVWWIQVRLPSKQCHHFAACIIIAAVPSRAAPALRCHPLPASQHFDAHRRLQASNGYAPAEFNGGAAQNSQCVSRCLHHAAVPDCVVELNSFCLVNLSLATASTEHGPVSSGTSAWSVKSRSGSRPAGPVFCTSRTVATATAQDERQRKIVMRFQGVAFVMLLFHPVLICHKRPVQRVIAPVSRQDSSCQHSIS